MDEQFQRSVDQAAGAFRASGHSAGESATHQLIQSIDQPLDKFQKLLKQILVENLNAHEVQLKSTNKDFQRILNESIAQAETRLDQVLARRVSELRRVFVLSNLLTQSVVLAVGFLLGVLLMFLLSK